MEVAQMIKHIAITEMHHMGILAETILLLGGNPLYRKSGGNYSLWQGGSVYYGYELCDRMYADLDTEYSTIQ
ncbi:MAG: hypothetical protein ACOX7H_02150 [Bacillota bacterium]|jgi:bacterioferritin